MIIGIGSDIARIERFERALKRHGPRFALRILGPEEHAAWQQKAQSVAFLAKRFAAKEAFVKALGLGLRRGLQWRDIQVLNDALGKPYFNLQGAAAEKASAAGVAALHITLSDEDAYAIAFVILEG